MEISTLYGESKGINAIVKTAQLSSDAFLIFLDAIKNYKRSEEVREFYTSGNLEYLKQNNAKIENNIIHLALSLPARLALHYFNDEEFNTIKIPLDHRSDFGKLRSEEYYINLSFNTSSNLESYNSKIQKELNLNSLFKGSSKGLESPQGQGIVHIDTRYSSTQYLSEILLKNYKKCYIFGNPGVGKTTYARWICNNWSNNKLSIDSIPIFVPVRELVFNSESPILNYIRNKFLYAEIQHLKEFVEYFGNSISFLFDGYDEISDEQKKFLRKEIRLLRSLNGDLRYFILGRPYAFLNEPIYNHELIHIEGFNDANVKNYIDNIIEKNPKENKSTVELYKIIQDNPILSDYATNPLILSYMVISYLTDDTVRDRLKNIKTDFNLYHEVYQWLLDYSLKTKEQHNVNPNDLESAMEFALHCSQLKKFVYQSKSYADKYFDSARLYSEVGLGTLNRYDTGQRWEFSFSTVTIQEYLTAQKFINDSIETSEFIELAKDPFYWNICKLIIGGLGENSEVSELQEILDSLSEIEKELGLDRFQYLGNMFLAESPKYLINTIVDKDLVDSLLNGLEKSYFDNWGLLSISSVTKIYNKSNRQKKKVFVDKTREIIEFLKVADHKTREATVSGYYVHDLIFAFELFKDELFVKLLFETLEILIRQLKAFNEKHQEESDGSNEEISILVIGLLRNLNNVEGGVLRNFDIVLNGFYGLLPHSIKDEVYRLKAKYLSNEDILSNVNSSLDKVKLLDNCPEHINTLGERLSEETTHLIPYPESLTDLVCSILLYASKHEIIQSEEDGELLNLAISTYVDKFLHPKFNDISAEIRINTDNLIEAIGMIKDCNSCLTIMHNLQYATYGEEESPIYDFKDVKVFDEVLENTISACIKSIEEGNELDINENMNFASFLLRNTVVGYHSFGKYHAEFIKIAESYSTLHMEVFSSTVFDSDGVEYGTIQGFLDVPRFDFDRNYSINFALERKEDFPFFKNELIVNLFEEKSNIYQPDHIEYFEEYISQKDLATVKLIGVLECDGLYKYKSNIPFLINSFKRLRVQLEKESEIVETYSFFIIKMISNLMVLLKMSDSHKVEEHYDIFKFYLGLTPVINTFEEKDYLESFDPVDLVPYILLYSISMSNDDIHKLDYEHYRQEHKSGHKRLLSLLSELLIPNRRIEELSNVISLLPILGQVLYDDLIYYASNFHILKT